MKFLLFGFLLFSYPLNTAFCQSMADSQKPGVEEKIIRTSDGVDLLVRIKGSGPPCLFVHGGPGTGCHWVEKISDGLLERHFRMIYLDQRGSERSTSPADGNYSLERVILDFEEVRRELGVERWLTMGHSFGGLLQAGYALRHPNVQRGIIMLNCTLNLEESLTESWIPKACEFLGVSDTAAYFAEDKSTLERIGRLVPALKERGIFWKMAYASPENEESINATSGDIPNRNRDAQSALFSCRDYWVNFKPATAEIDVPVLLFCGTTDWMAGPQCYRDVKFPRMLLRESRVGHIILLENRPDLEKGLIDFLEMFGSELRD